VGTRAAEFAGIAATGRAVRVPTRSSMTCGDKISALRIYFPMGLLIEQLSN